MSTPAQQIQTTVNNFVSEIARLARLAVSEALNASLGQLAVAPGGIAGVASPATLAALPTPIHLPRPKGAKRPPAELAAAANRLALFIKHNPGKRMEDIGKALEVKTKDLTLLVKKLVTAKSIYTVGEKRATLYYPTPVKKPKKRRPVKKSKKSGKTRPRQVSSSMHTVRAAAAGRI
jgi:hypothetical protein